MIVENAGLVFKSYVAAPLAEGPLKSYLIDAPLHLRLLSLGVILFLVMRFSPCGLIPEK